MSLKNSDHERVDTSLKKVPSPSPAFPACGAIITDHVDKMACYTSFGVLVCETLQDLYKSGTTFAANGAIVRRGSLIDWARVPDHIGRVVVRSSPVSYTPPCQGPRQLEFHMFFSTHIDPY